MRRTLSLAAAACLVLGSLAVFVSAQEPQGGRGAGARGGGAGGRQGGNPNATFPAQQRPPGDPALIARGNGLYGVNCRACHGVDLRGGDIGGPNLLRSQLALNDQEGELIGPVITGGRQTPGMPPMPPLPLPPDDLKAIAAYIHSVQATRPCRVPAGATPSTLRNRWTRTTCGQTKLTLSAVQMTPSTAVARIPGCYVGTTGRTTWEGCSASWRSVWSATTMPVPVTPSPAVRV